MTGRLTFTQNGKSRKDKNLTTALKTMTQLFLKYNL